MVFDRPALFHELVEARLQGCDLVQPVRLVPLRGRSRPGELVADIREVLFVLRELRD